MTTHISQRDHDLFTNLFVLELANNHWGSVDRGLKIIREHDVSSASTMSAPRSNSSSATSTASSTATSRAPRTSATSRRRATPRWSAEDFAALVEPRMSAVSRWRRPSMRPRSISASSSTSRSSRSPAPTSTIGRSSRGSPRPASPVIVSTGGSSEKDIDDLVTFFENRNIPLAINHCVSLYPCEDRRSS